VQALADVHATLERALVTAPEAAGVVSMDHELPFQASARVSPLGLPM
jgi:hypothetical protein